MVHRARSTITPIRVLSASAAGRLPQTSPFREAWTDAIWCIQVRDTKWRRCVYCKRDHREANSPTCSHISVRQSRLWQWATAADVRVGQVDLIRTGAPRSVPLPFPHTVEFLPKTHTQRRGTFYKLTEEEMARMSANGTVFCNATKNQTLKAIVLDFICSVCLQAYWKVLSVKRSSCRMKAF